MFYGQCWKCGERWGPGTASTCKCPDELPAYTFKPPSELVVSFLNTKPNHKMTFHNQDGKQIGALDFIGPEMTFTGDANESAKVFFDSISRSFKARLEQEIADKRAQRKPLTDEEIWLEYQRFWPFHPAKEPTLAKDIAKFARAIEAKLKENT